MSQLENILNDLEGMVYVFLHLLGRRLIIKALGGALIHPSLEAIQIAEIASINNRVFRTVGSPLVLPKHHTCLITPVNHNTIRTTIDHVSLKHKNVSDIQFRVANEKSSFC